MTSSSKITLVRANPSSRSEIIAKCLKIFRKPLGPVFLFSGNYCDEWWLVLNEWIWLKTTLLWQFSCIPDAFNIHKSYFFKFKQILRKKNIYFKVVHLCYAWVSFTCHDSTPLKFHSALMATEITCKTYKSGPSGFRTFSDIWLYLHF